MGCSESALSEHQVSYDIFVSNQIVMQRETFFLAYPQKE
jgi:hypothetical protein